MAYMCKRITGKECDACGECEEQPILEDIYGDPIYAGDKYYYFGGEVVAWDNLLEWAGDYIVIAEVE